MSEPSLSFDFTVSSSDKTSQSRPLSTNLKTHIHHYKFKDTKKREDLKKRGLKKREFCMKIKGLKKREKFLEKKEYWKNRDELNKIQKAAKILSSQEKEEAFKNLKAARLKQTLKAKLETIKTEAFTLLKRIDQLKVFMCESNVELERDIERVKNDISLKIAELEEQNMKSVLLKKQIEDERESLQKMEEIVQEETQFHTKQLEQKLHKMKTEVLYNIKATQQIGKEKQKKLQDKIDKIEAERLKAIEESNTRVQKLNLTYNAKKVEHEQTINNIKQIEEQQKHIFYSNMEVFKGIKQKEQLKLNKFLDGLNESFVRTQTEVNDHISKLKFINEQAINELKKQEFEAKLVLESQEIQIKELEEEKTNVKFEINEMVKNMKKIYVEKKNKLESDIKQLKNKEEFLKKQHVSNMEYLGVFFCREKENIRYRELALQTQEDSIRTKINKDWAELVKAFESQKIKYNNIAVLERELIEKRLEIDKINSELQLQENQKRLEVRNLSKELQQWQIKRITAELEKETEMYALKKEDEMSSKVVVKTEPGRTVKEEVIEVHDEYVPLTVYGNWD